MEDSVWIITVFEKLEHHKFIDFGNSRSVGWFQDEETAKEVVRHNCGDIWEGCYDYAVIEEIPQGLYPYFKKRTLWKYKGEKDAVYEQVEEPEIMKDYIFNVYFG